ncbi:MAG: hypothetical protein JXQ23_07325 [Clostridia bacterium]|nr:hypothetical protein [Clostridia bacterium]
MKKSIILFMIIILVFTGCSTSDVVPLTEEPIATFNVSKETSDPTESPEDTASESATAVPAETTVTPSPSSSPSSSAVAELTLDEKFAKVNFFLVAGVYTRNVLQNDMKVTEMFTLDKTNFIRIASNDFEQEIYAYNYISDNFTYLYYFDGELISKTVFNIDTGAILQDIDGYSELLKIDAEDLKSYFFTLIGEASLTIEEIS